jgi:hypothetical protein
VSVSDIFSSPHPFHHVHGCASMKPEECRYHLSLQERCSGSKCAAMLSAADAVARKAPVITLAAVVWIWLNIFSRLWGCPPPDLSEYHAERPYSIAGLTAAWYSMRNCIRPAPRVVPASVAKGARAGVACFWMCLNWCSHRSD